jgi:hypothetical protein
MPTTDYRVPQYDLDQSIEVARKITARGAGATVTNAEIASLLKYSGTANGSFLNRMAAARLFGLIEGTSKAISASDRARRIIHPEYPQTEERARLEAFKAVPLFAGFLDAYKGRDLPDDANLLNTLVGRFGVKDADAKAVLSRVLASAAQAGLFRVGGPTRMIEPTLSLPTSDDAPASPAEAAAPAALPTTPDPGARRFPKILDGALDLMPAGPPWDEAEYREWLAFFDQACRVYYRISRAKPESSA